MANSPASALVLRPGDRDRLVALSRSTKARAGVVLRARIVLSGADGMANERIAELLGTSANSVRKWRGRYERYGVEGLEDAARSGKPRVIDDEAVIVATLTLPPQRLVGVTHWSARLLAHELGISFASVARIWREWGIKPSRVGAFKFSTDPELEAKINDVAGLYLNPPERAVVLSVDEKSQIQALDRTQPILPMHSYHIERRSHDYVRHGTTTLFAALDILTGQVTATCMDKHRSSEFITFLDQVVRVYPGQELHIVMDNYATHKTPAVKAWQAKHPRVHFHFTPTSASWMNMVEIWFGLIQRQAIKRGIFTSVDDLIEKLYDYTNRWNKRAHPFAWTKTPEQIITKMKNQHTPTNPSTTTNTRH